MWICVMMSMYWDREGKGRKGGTYVVWGIEYSVSEEDRSQALSLLHRSSLRLAEHKVRVIVVIYRQSSAERHKGQLEPNLQLMRDFYTKPTLSALHSPAPDILHAPI